MATVNVKMVVGRYSVLFDNKRKTIDTMLDTIRKFFNTVGEKKKTDTGMSTTCTQITSFLPATLTDAKQLDDEHAKLKEACNDCMFFADEDKQRGSPRVRLSKSLNGLFEYVTHFQNLLHNRSVNKAAESAIKHRAAVLALIDEAKKLNKTFCTAISTFIKSDQFKQLTSAENSLVAIRPSEISGTKQEKRDFLSKIDNGVVEELQEDRRATRQFIQTDGVVPHEAAADDDEDVEVDDKPVVEEDAVVNEDDESDESDEYDENGGDTGDESGEMSQGAVLFESNLEVNNAKTLREVEEKAVVHNGRQLRVRKYRCIDLDTYGHLLANNAVDDYRKPSSSSNGKKSNGGAVNGGSERKRKRAPTDDEEDEGSAMTESDDDISENVALRAAEIAQQRAVDAAVAD